jgi:hypothetical protein
MLTVVATNSARDNRPMALDNALMFSIKQYNSWRNARYHSMAEPRWWAYCMDLILGMSRPPFVARLRV